MTHDLILFSLTCNHQLHTFKRIENRKSHPCKALEKDFRCIKAWPHCVSNWGPFDPNTAALTTVPRPLPAKFIGLNPATGNQCHPIFKNQQILLFGTRAINSLLLSSFKITPCNIVVEMATNGSFASTNLGLKHYLR